MFHPIINVNINIFINMRQYKYIEKQQTQNDNIFYLLDQALMDRQIRKRPQQLNPTQLSSKQYIQNVKQFLKYYKTISCNIIYQHDINTCQMYHQYDIRRNPYLEHTFAYYTNIQILQQLQQNGIIPIQKINEEMLCKNNIQLLYHPILYKTQRCQNYYNCPFHLLCSYLHSQDYKYFQYGQFFRFDINTHKIKSCSRRDYHQRKTCIYYHNQSDRRRPNFDKYCHQLCTKNKCNDQFCHYSHNKIEQVYHPSRYKSKFCKSYTNKNIKCQYKQFCAFAHTQAQIKIEMIHLLNRDQKFYIQKYKTVWCPDTLTHDRSGCVYAHNIQDFRRNPYKYNYQAEKCPFWNFQDQLKSIQDSGCKAGMNCDKCHGWMEQRYHPQIYKKNKISQMKQVNMTNMIIQKKIEKAIIPNNRKQVKDSKDKVSRIEKVVQEKVSQISKITQMTAQIAQNGVIRDVGAPFFKKQAISQSSRKTKALTTNIQSDESVREERNDQTQPNEIQNCPATRKKSMFLLSEDDIWKNSPDQENTWIEKKLDEERARSENKFDDCETVYSHSLKEAVGDNLLLRKLKNNNINQLRLKNLSQAQIQEFMFLNKPEKDQLNHKIKLYQLRRERNPIIYNIKLTKFFISKKKQGILQKTKVKKIKQQRLLKMKKKQIQKLEFLCQAQRRDLNLLLNEYKKLTNQQEFSQINEQITRFVSPKRGHQS